MKLYALNPLHPAWIGLGLFSTAIGCSAAGMEPQTLSNFQLNLGTVTGTLVQGPGRNFYGTTFNGQFRGPLLSVVL